MKIFHSEFVQNYGTYTFGYAVYAKREVGDKLSDIYGGGFLPYSGSLGVSDIFYEARSLRVALKDFSLNSENRRILKRFAGTLSVKKIPIKLFDWKNEDFISFCLAYFIKRHGKKIMPRNRLELILHSSILKNIVVYSIDDKPIAYVLEAGDETVAHFWYSFYDLSYTRKSLGLYLMIDATRRAYEEGKKYFYLGTVYGEKGLYKSNFKHIEFWNGNLWSEDIEALKKRSRSDKNRQIEAMDEWKGGLKNFF